MGRAIMLQGTSSNVGKSILAAGLCRIFRQDGYRIAPFKAQNMALNSYITSSGGEMGRAQAFQAIAAGIQPEVEMNPVLLKPTGQASSQVILLGKVIGNMSAQNYHLSFNTSALDVIAQSLTRLEHEYELLVIEGAGSPAEVNLKDRDITNMRIAKMTGAPVLLVTDIDRGGALAAVVGTLELLEPEERNLVAGIIINKFRGDRNLLQPAIDFLEMRTGKPVLGVVPFFTGLVLQDEDSFSLEERLSPWALQREKILQISVIQLPYISNYTDFDPLGIEPNVVLTYARSPKELTGSDLVIIPGSKNTIADLNWLHAAGLDRTLKEFSSHGIPVVGICGGYQMLGKELLDPHHSESAVDRAPGLGILNTVTVFTKEKLTKQVCGEVNGCGPLLEPSRGSSVHGYEIHMGKTELLEGTTPAFIIRKSGELSFSVPDGGVSQDGLTWGTYIHGVFDQDEFRRGFLTALRAWRQSNPGPMVYASDKGMGYQDLVQQSLDSLAIILRQNLDIAAIYSFAGLRPATPAASGHGL